MITLPRLITAVAGVAAVAILIAPPEGLTPDMVRVAALGIFTLGLWAGSLLPDHVSAILFFLVAMLFSVGPPEVVFAGFHSTATWLVFGGLILGLAVRTTGLGRRMAAVIASRIGQSYLGMLIGVSLIGLTSVFVVPSGMGRVVLLTPIILELCDRFGFPEESRGRIGILLAFSFATILPGFTILPANVPNVVMMGSSEAIYGMTPTYGRYMLLHFPILGVLKVACVIALAWLFHRDTPSPSAADSVSTEPVSAAEWRLGFALIAALLLWMTDSVHHVSPAWVALGAALLCLAPGLGMLTPNDFASRLNLAPLFPLAGILGVAALIGHVGLGDYLGRALLEAANLAPGDRGHALIAVVGTGMVLGLAATVVSVPAILTPLSQGIADVTGMPLDVVLMMQALAYSTIFFPYQLPPLLVAAQITGLGLQRTTRFALMLAAVTVTVLLPLDYLWWGILGFLD
jgi:di/tricarboxylate transporter